MLVAVSEFGGCDGIGEWLESVHGMFRYVSDGRWLGVRRARRRGWCRRLSAAVGTESSPQLSVAESDRDIGVSSSMSWSFRLTEDHADAPLSGGPPGGYLKVRHSAVRCLQL